MDSRNFTGVKKAVHGKATLSLCLYLLVVFYFLSLNFFVQHNTLTRSRGGKGSQILGGSLVKNHRFAWRANQ